MSGTGPEGPAHALHGADGTADLGAQQFLEVVLTYARWGWHVFPVRPRSKMPAIAEWPQAATTERAQVERWWGEEFSGFNIGIVTGERSGLMVIDVDNGPGKFGEDTLDSLCELHEKLPDTPTVLTPHGRHLYFRWPGFNLAENALGDDIDVQGDGRFVVAPPSVNADGVVYCWEQSLRPSSWLQ